MINEDALRTIGLLRPRFYQDGDRFCFLYGDSIQDGISGFGETPAKAAEDFYDTFYERRPLDPAPERIR